MNLRITENRVQLPLDLLGLPNPRRSWVACADLKVEDEDLVIRIYRKPFSFDTPSLIYKAEKEARKTFSKKGGYAVHRTLGTNVLHHIPVHTFLQDFNIPEGIYDFEKEIISTEEGEVTEMILKVDLFSARNVQKVKSFLIGFNSFDQVH